MRTTAALWLMLALKCIGPGAAAARLEIRPEPGHYAWWLRTSFTPEASQLFGLPLSAYDRSWCAADFWEPSLIPQEAWLDGFGSSGLQFTAKWNPTGRRPLLAKVGVSRSCKGKTEAFLAILDVGAPRTRVRYVARLGAPDFLALSVSSTNALQIWWCAECDNYTELHWDAKRRQYKFQPPDLGDL